MATFQIDTADARDETVEADYVESSDGLFEFKTYDPNYQAPMVVFVIRAQYVRAIRKTA